MSGNKFDLPEDSLGTLDEKGYRLFRYPQSVRGVYRNWRNKVYSVLIIIFLVLPWIKINGAQAILLDLANRRFSFFGVQFWGHDAPMIFFVLALSTLGLTFVTSIWGRVWCGWACPQTVFIDGVYRKIEEWVEGNHLQRAKLDKEPLNATKVRKRSIKWFLFFLVSFIISHSFLAYFVGADGVIDMITHPPAENWTSFLFVFSLCAILLFDFGWFREQFCIIACPYGRFQSVLMDTESMNILYDEKRGEPRKAKDVPKDQQGDCVNCYKCVAVCPTGIDIRRGVQAECIACTACIDACDEVMTKLKKPKGLIRYTSEADMERGEGEEKPRNLRPYVYFAMLTIVAVAFAIALYKRKPVDILFVRAIESPYQVEQTGTDEMVINHYKVKLKNHLIEDAELDLLFDHDEIEVVKPMFPVKMKGGDAKEVHVFFKFKRGTVLQMGAAKVPLTMRLISQGTVKEFEKEVSLVGPLK